ncbi:MAG: efflux RND transporter periplasmic adaptor subunit [Desulfacinum sp.]|nr:efflux RND transporter periplasmic adaptor subunit [Desulfacinum sp.]
MKRLIILVLLVCVALGGTLAYRKWKAPKGFEILETAKAEKASIRDVLVATGMIKPQVGAQIKIGARATGTILDMRVRVGDTVRKGDLIAVIDDREIQKALASDRAALEAARKALEEVERTYPERIREAEARRRLARITWEREAALIREDYTTRDAVDRARSELDAAEAVLQRLRDEFETQKAIALARIQEAEARLKQDEIRWSYTRITAPIDGVVMEVTGQEGETVVTGLQVANLVTVMDPTRLEMQIYVDETDVGRIAPGLSVEYSVDTYPERTFMGTVEKIYPQPVVRDNIVYYLAIVKIPEKDALQLRPEMTTYCRVVLTRKDGVLSVPNSAVKFENGQQVVYVVGEAGAVTKTVVQVGIRGEDRTEILSGLREGQVVAIKFVPPAKGQR